jgi:hypothetical protein
VPRLPLPDSLIETSQHTVLPQVIQRLRDRTAELASAPRASAN